MNSPHIGPETRHALRTLRSSAVVGGIPVVVLTVSADVLAKAHSTSCDDAPYSDCLKIGDHWRIRLQRGVGDFVMRDALEHEWAHAIDEYTNGEATEPHRVTWGEWQSKCHRAIYGDTRR